ncbi:hypothetical protein IEO21_01505 [Rhodonia placenta]|uniref:Uncharacterized protein n=2 Tax=Rhodonia placenta TaxID=104341 RepID=A0A1X6NCF9_9APHY|nr:hypothetical protein POSPLADRAFT_1177769 [Postia placenta MAD-698-R-SB12]KAF9820291.1 hypothetical protein IEO21_01505 [Postia placenta]OSX66325.1 hypothetical protein POSPLADRAFT_1177769 [Postia placenta MAD-698-R-SB12]
MIIDPNTTKMTPNQDMQAPPSYDAAMKDITSSGPFVTNGTSTADSVKVPLPEGTPAQGPSPQVPSMPATTVYNYVNPITQEQIVSLLPPDHPQMICLQQGGHVPRTHYGVLGILAAVFWFPWGIGCCLLDRRTTCERCGAVMDDGFCG